MDPSFQKLALLYAGMLLVNATVSAALFRKQRDPLRRGQLFLWVTAAIAFVAEAALTQNDLAIVLGYATCIGCSLSIAQVLVLVTGSAVRFHPFLALLGAALVAACVAYALGASFFWVSMPTAVAVAAPSLYVATRALATRWGTLSISAKGVALASLAFGLHMLDFCVLRDRPAAVGFAMTTGTIIIFAMSIFVPAAVIEQAAAQQRVLENDKVRLEAEIGVAQRIQAALVPDAVTTAGYAIAGACRPALDVGGDCFDILPVDGGAWVFIGDVSGHGVPAGLIMMMTQTAIRSAVSAGAALDVPLSPARVLDVANRALRYNVERIGRGQYVTATALRIEGDTVRYAGLHQDLLVYRARSGRVEQVETSGIWLGVVDDVAPLLDEASLTLDAGDVLLLHTDGWPEARRRGAMLGLAGLCDRLAEAAARRASPEAIVRSLLDALDGAEVEDDATVVVIGRA